MCSGLGLFPNRRHTIRHEEAIGECVAAVLNLGGTGAGDRRARREGGAGACSGVPQGEAGVPGRESSVAERCEGPAQVRVRCQNGSIGNGSCKQDYTLTPGAEYHVIGIESGDFRILDHGVVALLFPPDLFEVVSSKRPSDWDASIEDGSEYANPPALNAPGFWEDLYDGHDEAKRVFARYLNERLGDSSAA